VRTKAQAKNIGEPWWAGTNKITQSGTKLKAKGQRAKGLWESKVFHRDPYLVPYMGICQHWGPWVLVVHLIGAPEFSLPLQGKGSWPVLGGSLIPFWQLWVLVLFRTLENCPGFQFFKKIWNLIFKFIVLAKVMTIGFHLQFFHLDQCFYLVWILSKKIYKNECKLQIVKIYERKNRSPFANIVLVVGILSQLMLHSKFLGATSNIDGWGWRSSILPSKQRSCCCQVTTSTVSI
jgi:hypothetical protein